jgi:hypothetical protein
MTPPVIEKTKKVCRAALIKPLASRTRSGGSGGGGCHVIAVAGGSSSASADAPPAPGGAAGAQQADEPAAKARPKAWVIPSDREVTIRSESAQVGPCLVRGTFLALTLHCVCILCGQDQVLHLVAVAAR